MYIEKNKFELCKVVVVVVRSSWVVGSYGEDMCGERVVLGIVVVLVFNKEY